MIKHPWDNPTDDEPDNLDTLLTMLLLIAVVCLGAFTLGMVYQLAQPLIGWILGAMT